MIPIPYIKAHTNKNDFIFIPLSLVSVAKGYIPQITSHHNGISADGVVFYERDEETFTVKFYNRDGSSAPICGNSLIAAGGIYQFIKHEREEITIKTETGERKVIPFDEELWGGLVSPLDDAIKRIQVVVEDRVFEGFYTEVPGNPHFIIENEPEDALFNFFAPKISTHNSFPKGTNVEFIFKKNNSLKARVYERGVGETLSCATGASAIYLLYKFVKLKLPGEIHFRGGKYKFFEEDGFVGLTAKPEIVSRGMIFL